MVKLVEMKADNYPETEDKVDIANIDIRIAEGDIDSVDAAKTVSDDDDAEDDVSEVEFERQPLHLFQIDFSQLQNEFSHLQNHFRFSKMSSATCILNSAIHKLNSSVSRSQLNPILLM